MMIDDTTTVVYTPAELSDAVSADNGIDHVYLGDNITMTAGIRVHIAKTSLIIDGYPPEAAGFFTLTDAGSTEGQIYVNGSPSLNITFQNLIITGRSFFGMPYIHTYANSENVTVTYQNVTYSGPQMIYHINGLTRFINCSIEITGSTSADTQEVGEICKVEIGGVTNILKSNTDHALFWFYGASTRRPSLRILAGADVTINTAHYFMFETYPPDYIIESGASFTLNTNSGIAWDSAHTVNSFQVGENATFRYTQATNRGYASLYITGDLTVNARATFYMQADFYNNNPLIRFTGASTGLYLYSPRSFALYNRGNAQALAFLFPASTPFVFTGNQVNIWDTPTAFPAAGTFDDEPRYKWKRQDWTQFRLEGRAGTSNTIIDSHNFTAEDLDNMPELINLQLHQAVVFSEGYLPLTVNPIVIGLRPITGMTSKKARVRVSGITIGPYPECDANDDGFFTVDTTGPTAFVDTFTVISNTPFLLTTLTTESREEGELILLYVPEAIPFITPPLPDFTDIILPRRVPNATVIVSDTRAERTEWVLWAKLEGPLRTEENDVLTDAAVFAREDGSLITLSDKLAPVHTDGPYEDIDVPVMWDNNRGVLARITVPIRSGRRYTTQMGWAILPIGVEPEEVD